MGLQDLIEAGKKKAEEQRRAEEEARRQKQVEVTTLLIANWQDFFRAAMEALPADLLECVPEEVPGDFFYTSTYYILRIATPNGGHIEIEFVRDSLQPFHGWRRCSPNVAGVRPGPEDAFDPLVTDDFTLAAAYAAEAIPGLPYTGD